MTLLKLRFPSDRCPTPVQGELFAVLVRAWARQSTLDSTAVRFSLSAKARLFPTSAENGSLLSGALVGHIFLPMTGDTPYGGSGVSRRRSHASPHHRGRGERGLGSTAGPGHPHQMAGGDRGLERDGSYTVNRMYESPAYKVVDRTG